MMEVDIKLVQKKINSFILNHWGCILGLKMSIQVKNMEEGGNIKICNVKNKDQKYYSARRLIAIQKYKKSKKFAFVFF